MTTTPTPTPAVDAPALATANLLTKAADVIDTNGWLQGALIDYDAATEVGYSAAPVCVVGAIRLATGAHPDDAPLSSTLALWAFGRWLFEHGQATGPADTEPYLRVTEWNDTVGRTATEVVTRLREAAREVATW